MKNFLKFISNSNIKRFFIIFALLCAFILVSSISYVDAVSSNIAESVFRLHVIANSDSAEDQNLKYKVRDAVLNYMESISQNCSSKEEVIELAKNHKDDFQNIARQVICDNGYDYPINVYIGKSDFPTKNYGDISLPAGNYDSLKIEIGESKGQNWWCVMFPPLCFVDITTGIVPEESKQIMQNDLGSEEYNIISNHDNSNIRFKFSLIEMFKNLRIANN